MDTLFDSPCRYMSDSELLYEISNNRQIVSDIERSNEVIDLEKIVFLFDSWTQEGSRGSRGDIQEATVAAGGTQGDIRECRHIQTDGPLIGDLPNEEFWVISLNQSAKLIKKVRISVGGITQTSADIRLICEC